MVSAKEQFFLQNSPFNTLPTGFYTLSNLLKGVLNWFKGVQDHI
jgi:hypothetical protein